jgi:hypothetical protein
MLKTASGGQDEESPLDDHQEGAGTKAPGEAAKLTWTARSVAEIKRKFQERRAKKLQETAQDKMGRRLTNATVAIAFLTAALVAVAAAQFYTGEGQLRVTQGQLDEMRNQRLATTAQMRANLRRENPTMTPIGEGGKMIGPAENLAGWEVSPNWKNVGSTNAQDFLGWFDIRAFDPSPGQRVTAADCPQLLEPSPSPGRLIVVPGIGVSHLAKPLRIGDVVKAKEGTKYILMWGHIEYKDIFPDTPVHHDDWCVAVIPNDLQRSVFSLPILRETID